MVGPLIGAATIAAGVIAFAGHALAPPGPAGTVSPFGGPIAVRIAHVGAIDVDLRDGGVTGLHRVACAVPAAAGTSCFVAP